MAMSIKEEVMLLAKEAARIQRELDEESKKQEAEIEARRFQIPEIVYGYNEANYDMIHEFDDVQIDHSIII